MTLGSMAEVELGALLSVHSGLLYTTRSSNVAVGSFRTNVVVVPSALGSRELAVAAKAAVRWALIS
jgi:hypothetical protein